MDPDLVCRDERLKRATCGGLGRACICSDLNVALHAPTAPCLHPGGSARPGRATGKGVGCGTEGATELVSLGFANVFVFHCMHCLRKRWGS
eukprot:11089623-Alexandrium_andersonii.AAC.1